MIVQAHKLPLQYVAVEMRHHRKIDMNVSSFIGTWTSMMRCIDQADLKTKTDFIFKS